MLTNLELRLLIGRGVARCRIGISRKCSVSYYLLATQEVELVSIIIGTRRSGCFKSRIIEAFIEVKSLKEYLVPRFSARAEETIIGVSILETILEGVSFLATLSYRRRRYANKALSSQGNPRRSSNTYGLTKGRARNQSNRRRRLWRPRLNSQAIRSCRYRLQRYTRRRIRNRCYIYTIGLQRSTQGYRYLLECLGYLTRQGTTPLTSPLLGIYIRSSIQFRVNILRIRDRARGTDYVGSLQPRNLQVRIYYVGSELKLEVSRIEQSLAKAAMRDTGSIRNPSARRLGAFRRAAWRSRSCLSLRGQRKILCQDSSRSRPKTRTAASARRQRLQPSP